MKKIIILLLSISLLVGLGIYALSLVNAEEKSDTELKNFAIEAIETIDKVIISNTRGQKLVVIKKGDSWSDSENHCLVQENIDFMLDAIKNIEFKGYVSENAKENYRKKMIAQHTKVEIFQNGELTTTWYIGPETPDRYGQIMLLDSKEHGKSKYPVMMRIKNMNGVIGPRFKADYREWMCSDIFSYRRKDIKEVDLQFPQEPAKNFTIKGNGIQFDVLHNGQKLPQVDTSNVYRYLQLYSDINYSSANYLLSNKQVDSVKASQAFCVLTLTESNGTKKQLRMFPIALTKATEFPNESVAIDNNSGDTFWCELNDGTLVKCQYFHFDPILMGHLYFPALKPEEN